MTLQKPSSHASAVGEDKAEARYGSDRVRETDPPSAAGEEGDDDRPGYSKASPPLPPAAVGNHRKFKASVLLRISAPGSEGAEGAAAVWFGQWVTPREGGGEF